MDWTLKDNRAARNRFTSISGKAGRCSLAAEAIDDGISFVGNAMDKEGNGGIRTHFMDVVFGSSRIVAEEANADEEVFPRVLSR